MKITKQQLKKLIEEELKINLFEQQSQADLDRQAELTSDAAETAAMERYGSEGGSPPGRPRAAEQRKQIDLLTDIRDLLSQILNKVGL